jgi:excisionase family DNA binding protein
MGHPPKEAPPRDEDEPVKAEVREDRLWVTLADGRVIGTPLGWYITLSNAAPEQLAHYELSAAGVHWPDLDEDLSVNGMLLGRRPAWPRSVEEWQAHLAEIRQEEPDESAVMTVPQVAATYGLSRFTVNSAIRRKRIAARKVGGIWLIRRSDAEACWGHRTSGA